MVPYLGYTVTGKHIPPTAIQNLQGTVRQQKQNNFDGRITSQSSLNFERDLRLLGTKMVDGVGGSLGGNSETRIET